MVEPLYGYYGQNRSVDDRKYAALSEFLFRLFSRFRCHCGYAKLASNVTTQNNFFYMRPFRLKKSTIDGKRATKATSAGTYTVAQWLVASNFKISVQENKKGKTGFELSRGQSLLRVMRSAGTTLQQPSCDKQHREKTRKVGYRIIVSRGDWLGNPQKSKMKTIVL